MIKPFTLLAFFLFISFSGFSQVQNSITTDSVLQTGPCAGSQVIVRYSTTGNFPMVGNTYTAQLSNAWGQFTNPVNIGSVNFNIGIVPATLPANATFGFLYRIRVVSSNPAVVGSPSPNTVIITSNPFVATISTQGGNTICPGETKTLQVLVPANSYLWSTGATTQSITVTQPGSYWVRVTDLATCQARDTMNIIAGTNCAPLGAPEHLTTRSLRVYPNPVSARGVLHLDDLQGRQWEEIKFVDALGRVQANLKTSGTSAISLKPLQLTPGLYQVMLLRENKTMAIKRIILTD